MEQRNARTEAGTWGPPAQPVKARSPLVMDASSGRRHIKRTRNPAGRRVRPSNEARSGKVAISKGKHLVPSDRSSRTSYPFIVTSKLHGEFSGGWMLCGPARAHNGFLSRTYKRVPCAHAIPSEPSSSSRPPKLPSPTAPCPVLCLRHGRFFVSHLVTRVARRVLCFHVFPALVGHAHGGVSPQFGMCFRGVCPPSGG